MLTNSQRQSLKIIAALLIIKRRRCLRNDDTNSSLTGQGYLQELLSGNPTHSQEILRMSVDNFLGLCNHFKSKGWLRDSRFVTVEENMAMFLMTIGHNVRNRLIKRRFNHSTQTIHFYFHEVLRAMMNFAKEIIIPSTYEDQNQVQQYHMLRDIFEGAIGALDGTLIHAVVPRDKQVPYRGRGRGECYQNVLAVCDFNMIFNFVCARWEGVAHDSRVLTETMRDPSNNFPFPPPDKYYLCDAAYSHTRRFMAPYRNVRYWLSDFHRGGRPRNKEEAFNKAHAKLRNVIERAFGVLKARFSILKRMPSYPLEVQRDIVIACMAIHNFIRKCNTLDMWFQVFEDDDVAIDQAGHQSTSTPLEVGSQADQAFMRDLRDQIASNLFRDLYL